LQWTNNKYGIQYRATIIINITKWNMLCTVHHPYFLNTEHLTGMIYVGYLDIKDKNQVGGEGKSQL
jgi:hypothetical protein